jgi:hypothetical protein
MSLMSLGDVGPSCVVLTVQRIAKVQQLPPSTGAAFLYPTM